MRKISLSTSCMSGICVLHITEIVITSTGPVLTHGNTLTKRRSSTSCMSGICVLHITEIVITTTGPVLKHGNTLTIKEVKMFSEFFFF